MAKSHFSKNQHNVKKFNPNSSSKPVKSAIVSKPASNKKSSEFSTKNSKKRVKKQVRFSGIPSSDSEQEGVDLFSDQEDQIDLSSSEEKSGNEDLFDEEAVFDLPGDDDSEEEEQTDKDYEKDHDDEEGEEDEGDYLSDEEILNSASEDEEENDKSNWGRKRRTYYDADTDALEEQAQEADKLQKKKLTDMRREDFGPLYQSKFTMTTPIILHDSEEEDNETAVCSKDNSDSLSEDLNELAQEFQVNLKQVKQVLEPFMTKSKDLPRSGGLKFLSIKYQLLTNYCNLLLKYLQLKVATSNKSPSSSPALKGLTDELIRHRLLIEKLKPIELALKHQIETLLNAKPNETILRPGMGSFDGDNDDEAAVGQDNNSNEIYKAPKITPVHFPDSSSASGSRKDRKSQKFPELEKDFDSAPEEEAINVAATLTNQNKSAHREMAERETYEEDNFVRFTLSKAEKNRLMKANKLNDELDDLDDFMNELEDRGTKLSAKNQYPAAKNNVKSKYESEGDSDAQSELSEIEDDLAEQVKSIKHQKNLKKSGQNKPPKKTSYRSIQDMSDIRSERPASKQILQNRGLTVNRSKDIKNPRVKQRRKFEKAVKRLPSFHPVAKTQSSTYGGERSGIRTNISKSTKFN